MRRKFLRHYPAPEPGKKIGDGAIDMKGLIIDSPHIDNILDGRKTWEMRSTGTKQRGLIALIRKGSGTVIGTVELIDSVGPLTDAERLAGQPHHLVPPERFERPEAAKYRHGWVVRSPCRFPRPIRYQHPPGAVIWVALNEEVSGQVEQASRDG